MSKTKLKLHDYLFNIYTNLNSESFKLLTIKQNKKFVSMKEFLCWFNELALDQMITFSSLEIKVIFLYFCMH